ncbi:MAG: 4-hydroxy-tetrahydrodipicolinate synthase [Deltaproteobacteria bacterium]|nr:4-hydroxy-tetrahydrodipicolinate synthase [Deltaproteobacteria bacterium]
MGKPIEGIITAVVTPFDENENVDEAAFRKIIDYLIESGVNGLFPAGSQGEFFALTDEEKKRLIDVAVEEAGGRVFVMPNTGAITTRESIALTQYAEKAGADCVSIITPFFIHPNQEELREHFRAICQSVEIPVLCYNNPGRTGGVSLTPETLASLAGELPNFAGIKDSSGDLTQVAEMIRLCPPDFRVIMGRDTLIYGGLMYGAAGAIAATSNVAPRLVVGIYQAFKAGDHEKAKDYQRQLAPLRMAFGLGSFPVVIKEALTMIGLPAGRCRRPIQPLSDQNRRQLHDILLEMGIVSG